MLFSKYIEQTHHKNRNKKIDQDLLTGGFISRKETTMPSTARAATIRKKG